MSIRSIIKIDEDKCSGCSLCIPNCPEGALQVIDGKARLVSDLFCDGLGACLGHCPEGAIAVEDREAEQYDEKKVMENIAAKGINTIKAHLHHLKSHGAMEYYREALDFLKERGITVPSDEKQEEPCGCPGSRMVDMRTEAEEVEPAAAAKPAASRLRQWPVQLKLVPVKAPYFDNADLLIAADCVPFSYPDFHETFLRSKAVVIGCPKLDDADFYKNKLASIFAENNINSITVVHMEVPCCFGLVRLVNLALEESGKDIPLRTVEISIGGKIKEI